MVDSPVGKGIVLERKNDVDRSDTAGEPENWIVWGEAEKAIRIYMTEDGIVHWAGRPKQVVIDTPQCLTMVNGKLKEYMEVNLYGLLEEGKGDQQFVLNADDSLSPMQSPDFVWGGNLQPLEKLGWIRSQPL